MRPERRIILKNISTCDSSRFSKRSKTLIAFITPPAEIFIVVTKDYLLPFPFSMDTHTYWGANVS